jgi:phosphorylcholine metabolism protein LicD
MDVVNKELKLQAQKNLRDVKAVADKVGIKFMVMEGTLLGFHRDNDFVVGDENDIDLGIMEEEIDKIEELTDGLEALGFNYIKKFALLGEFEGAALERGGNHVDLMRMHRDGETVYNFGRAVINNKVELLSYEYPSHLFDGYGTISYRGDSFLTPNDIEAFLEITYGEWTTPDPDYCYYSIKSRPNIKICKF